MGIQKLSLIAQERAQEDRKHVYETVKLLNAVRKTPEQLKRMIETNIAYMKRERKKGFTCFRNVTIANEAASIILKQYELQA